MILEKRATGFGPGLRKINNKSNPETCAQTQNVKMAFRLEGERLNYKKG